MIPQGSKEVKASPSQSINADSKPLLLIDQINEIRFQLQSLAGDILTIDRAANTIKRPDIPSAIPMEDIDFLITADNFDTYVNPSNEGVDIPNALREVSARVRIMHDIVRGTVRHIREIV